MGHRIKPAIERLLAKRRIDPATGCWLFTGYALDTDNPKYAKGNGYGYIRDDWRDGRHGKLILVHRLAYRELVGAVPPGFEIDHDCRRRLCFNPAHLIAVTHRVNVQLTVFRRANGEVDHIPF